MIFVAFKNKTSIGLKYKLDSQCNAHTAFLKEDLLGALIVKMLASQIIY